MAEVTVTIDAPGGAMPGHLATPEGWPPGPAIVIVQEWWGLNDNIRSVARRLADEGYAALAPDLYRGQQADEPDEARKLSMELDRPRALEDLGAAVGWLLEQRADGVAVIGFCMGASLTWQLAHMDERLLAAVPFYGSADVEGRGLKCPLMAHFGGADHSISPEKVESLTRHLESQPYAHHVYVYEGAGHAFFNDQRPAHHPEAAALAWQRTIEFLENELGGS